MKLKPIFFTLFFLLLALSGVYAQQSTIPLERDLYIYFDDIDIYDTRPSLSLKIGQNDNVYTTTIVLEEGTNMYHFVIPDYQDGEIFFKISYGKKYLEDVIPSVQVGQFGLPEPVFIGVKNLDYFPRTTEIWTRDVILANLQKKDVKIEGAFDIEPRNFSPNKIDHVNFSFPFLQIYPEEMEEGVTLNKRVIETRIYQADLEINPEWSEATFELRAPLPRPTLAFMEVNEQYFPVVLFPHDRIRIPLEYNAIARKGLSGKDLDMQFRVANNSRHNDISLAQSFFNERYPEGLSLKEMEKIKQVIMDSPQQRSDTIMAWAQGLDAFMDSKHHSSDRILDMINNLGSRSWPEAFEEAYEDYVDRANRKVRRKINSWTETMLSFLSLSFLLFIISVIARLSRRSSFLSVHLPKFELVFHSLFWILNGFHFIVNSSHGVTTVSNPLNLFFLVAVLVLIYANALYFTPNMLAQKRWKLYFGSLLISGVAFMLTIGLFSINPFKNFQWVYANGIWFSYSPPYSWNYLVEEFFFPIYAVSLVLAPSYGLLRNFLLKRVPKLKEQKDSLQAELKALKNQISPHFFFNSLNTVYSFAMGEESPKTAEAITKLSDMMRFVIYHGEKKNIPLSQELDYLQDYIELQKLRLNAVKHDIRFRIDGEPEGIDIAPLILITPIENAFKHGISMNKDSYIYIDLLIQRSGVILTVENSQHDGKLVKVDEHGRSDEGGLGIENTRQRLELLYPNRFDWYIEEGEGKYLTQLSIDLQKA
ncbi:MAG: sensor histidine kinase [Bacteroidota bacterium]